MKKKVSGETMRRMGRPTMALLLMLLGAASVCARAEAADRASAPVGTDDFILFNFEQVDIRVFTQIVGNYTGRRLVVADDVTGTITVVSPRVPRESAFTLFASVLESSGYTIVEEGGINRVVRLPERRTGMGTVVADGDTPPPYGLITRILRLDHVTASEMRKMLETHLQRKDAVSALDETNHLIITDTADAVSRVEALVRQLDRPGMARMMAVHPLEHADAVQLARQLTQAHAETQSRADQLLARIPPADGAAQGIAAMRPPVIVAAEHANRLILTGTPRQVDQLRALIAEMDVPAPTGRSALNAILLNYIKAEDVAKNLTALLDKSATQNPPGLVRRNVSVEAVLANNALLVDAAPEDFAQVKRLVESLDVMPQQVHISVLIAEVSDADAETMGVTLTALNSPGSVGDTVFAGATRSENPSATDGGLLSALSSGLFGQGLTFGLAHGAYRDASGNIVADYPAIFNLDMIRRNSKVKILSDTSLGAQNNHEAEVAIVDNIGILESTVSGSGSDRDIIQNITRMDVGVKVTMTPYVIPGGLVRVELQPSIEAVTESGASSGVNYVPTISRRMVKTTMTVPDGQTIVIAGLTRNDESEVRKRIPFLGDLPLIGWLFRWNAKSAVKTNILIFVTPRIMFNPDDAQIIRQAHEARAGMTAEGVMQALEAPPEEDAASRDGDGAASGE